MRNLVTLRSVAFLLVTFPAAAVFAQPQPGFVPTQPGQAGPQDRVYNVRLLAHRLAMEIERLQEDSLVDLQRQNSREVYHQADRALRDVTQFEHALVTNSPFENYVRDYQLIHRNIHKTLQDLRSVNPNIPGLERDILRVEQAEHQLFFALTPQDAISDPVAPIATDRQEQIHRLSQSAALESQRFARISSHVLDGPRGRNLQDAINQYSTEAVRFSQAFDRGDRNRELRREFATLDASWQNVIAAINQVPQNEVVGLRRQADRIETTQEQLQTLMGVKAERPEVRFEFPLPRR